MSFLTFRSAPVLPWRALASLPLIGVVLGLIGPFGSYSGMSVAELKEQIVALSPDERRELAALITHLNRKDSPEFLAEMDRRLDGLSERKYIAEDLQRKHRELNEQGK